MKKITAFIFFLLLLVAGADVCAFAENYNVTVNVSEGETLSGEYEFVAFGESNISLSHDMETEG